MDAPYRPRRRARVVFAGCGPVSDWTSMDTRGLACLAMADAVVRSSLTLWSPPRPRSGLGGAPTCPRREDDSRRHRVQHACTPSVATRRSRSSASRPCRRSSTLYLGTCTLSPTNTGSRWLCSGRHVDAAVAGHASLSDYTFIAILGACAQFGGMGAHAYYLSRRTGRNAAADRQHRWATRDMSTVIASCLR